MNATNPTPDDVLHAIMAFDARIAPHITTPAHIPEGTPWRRTEPTANGDAISMDDWNRALDGLPTWTHDAHTLTTYYDVDEDEISDIISSDGPDGPTRLLDQLDREAGMEAAEAEAYGEE